MATARISFESGLRKTERKTREAEAVHPGFPTPLDKNVATGVRTNRGANRVGLAPDEANGNGILF